MAVDGIWRKFPVMSTLISIATRLGIQLLPGYFEHTGFKMKTAALVLALGVATASAFRASPFTVRGLPQKPASVQSPVEGGRWVSYVPRNAQTCSGLLRAKAGAMCSREIVG